MASEKAEVTVVCKKTVLLKKTELKWGVAFKETTTTYPTFKIDAEFADSKSKNAKQKKSFTCPFCNKGFKYKAFRSEFSLRTSAKWVGLLITISILLFLTAMFLFVFGEWDINSTMVYFGIWGIFGFIIGLGLLSAQILRYFAFYRKNKYRYVFSISELRPQHFTTEHLKHAKWDKLPG